MAQVAGRERRANEVCIYTLYCIVYSSCAMTLAANPVWKWLNSWFSHLLTGQAAHDDDTLNAYPSDCVHSHVLKAVHGNVLGSRWHDGPQQSIGVTMDVMDPLAGTGTTMDVMGTTGVWIMMRRETGWWPPDVLSARMLCFNYKTETFLMMKQSEPDSNCFDK